MTTTTTTHGKPLRVLIAPNRIIVPISDKTEQQQRQLTKVKAFA
jgi:hypothetical protein